MSQKLWRKNLINITPYTAGEQPKNDRIIKLNANENPYPPSPQVQNALRQFNYENLKKYPSSNADRLKEAIAEVKGLTKENIFCANGSDDALATAFRAFFNSDKPIFFPDITYSFYPVWCELLKIPYITKEVDENFRIDPKDYYEDNGGVVLPNPNAPTSIGEARDFIEDILSHNQESVVIIDEAYADFGEYSCIELIEKYDNLLVTMTFSKSRSLAGLRAAMVFGQPELIKYMQAVKDSYNSYPLDAIAINLACASVKDEDYLEQTVAKIKKTRWETAAKLENLGFKLPKSQTNFLFAAHKEIPAKEIFEYLKSKGIYVRYFNKPRIDNYLRITIGTDQQMNLLCEELEKFIRNL